MEVLASWVREFILFHDKQHPSALGLPAVTHFLDHVGKTEPDPLASLAMARLFSGCGLRVTPLTHS